MLVSCSRHSHVALHNPCMKSMLMPLCWLLCIFHRTHHAASMNAEQSHRVGNIDAKLLSM